MRDVIIERQGERGAKRDGARKHAQGRGGKMVYVGNLTMDIHGSWQRLCYVAIAYARRRFV